MYAPDAELPEDCKALQFKLGRATALGKGIEAAKLERELRDALEHHGLLLLKLPDEYFDNHIAYYEAYNRGDFAECQRCHARSMEILNQHGTYHLGSVIK